MCVCVCVCVIQHKWKYFNSVSEKAVSHADFMNVLSNIEYIIIKASYGTRLQQSRYIYYYCTQQYTAVHKYTDLLSHFQYSQILITAPSH